MVPGPVAVTGFPWSADPIWLSTFIDWLLVKEGHPMALIDDIRNNWQSTLVTLAGIWVLASPFVFEKTSIGITLNGVIFGFILIGYGAYDIKQKQIWGQRLARYWAMIAIGLWIAISPWFFLEFDPIRTSNLVTGIIIALLAAHTLYLKSERSISATDLGSDFREE